jgi:hypothetical protein
MTANETKADAQPVQMNERVHFRIFMMPCCHIMICWVNSRLPNYCPECGERVRDRLKPHTPDVVLLNDFDAWLKYKDKDATR